MCEMLNKSMHKIHPCDDVFLILYVCTYLGSRFNQFLEAVGSDRQVWSFGAELADGVAWCSLLNAIDPASCPPPDENDPEANAASAVQAVHKMGIKVCACVCVFCVGVVRAMQPGDQTEVAPTHPQASGPFDRGNPTETRMCVLPLLCVRKLFRRRAPSV